MNFLLIWNDYKFPIILGSVSLFFISISIILLIKTTQIATPIEFSEGASVSGITAGSITIDIEGAVVHPGVYSMPMGSRVEDSITKAGGLTDTADRARIEKTINRAAKLSDGAKLYFPSEGELPNVPKQGEALDTLSSGAGPTNINAASQHELEALPGIGPVTAKKIIDNRPYQTLEELVSKKAMGQSLFEKLKSQISL